MAGANLLPCHPSSESLWSLVLTAKQVPPAAEKIIIVFAQNIMLKHNKKLQLLKLQTNRNKCHAVIHIIFTLCITARRDEISRGCGVKARGLADAAGADDVLHLKFHMGFECDFRGATGPLFFAPRFVALRWLVLRELVWRGIASGRCDSMLCAAIACSVLSCSALALPELARATAAVRFYQCSQSAGPFWQKHSHSAA